MILAPFAGWSRSWLVGAARFELATCCTQNSRATKLRYAPPVPGSIYGIAPASTRWWVKPAGTGALREDRVTHPIAGMNAARGRLAAGQFQHGAYRSIRWLRAEIAGLGTLANIGDAPIGADEQHVQGDQGIFHPESDRLLIVEIKEHAVIGRQFDAEHQPALTRGIILGHLDTVMDRTRGGLDGELSLIRGLGQNR